MAQLKGEKHLNGVNGNFEIKLLARQSSVNNNAK